MPQLDQESGRSALATGDAAMTPLEFVLLVLLISVAAGVLGSLLGLGGGVIVIPALTLLFGIDIRYAIGASIVSVIATSSGAAAAYVRDGLTNLRVAMVLELATTSGALTGAYLAGLLSGRWLFIIFGVVLAYSSLMMIRKLNEPEYQESNKSAPWADYLRLHSSYFDKRTGREIYYRVTSTRIGLALMYVAGAISGLLGIGSGSLKVPAMDLAMHMPIKVSTATSNFMIGVTAAASAGVYYMRGEIDPFIAAPVAVGVLIGALGGSYLLPKLRSSTIRLVFVVVLLWISGQMLWEGIRG
ncbi:MAG TPA: sulfite exporter TauE/SafE family protein [Lacipirellulaceae bacterium]|nr:sulfite exporter TauE/SafE family protein [Lacipirellulaceae bacterium]